MLVQFFAFSYKICVLLTLINEFNNMMTVTVTQKLVAIYIEARHWVPARYRHKYSVPLKIYDFFESKYVPLSYTPNSALNYFSIDLVDVLQDPLVLHRQFDSIFEHKVE